MTNKKERKHFKFYKSYYDVFCELPDKEKLSFIEAIFNKQFFNIDTELKGLAKFAYISQKHNIENQVQGFIDKMGEIDTPMPPPPLGGTQGGMPPPPLQPVTDNIQHITNNKQHIIENHFEIFWREYPHKIGKPNALKKYKDKEHDAIMHGLSNWKEYWEEAETEQRFIPHPATWLNQQRWKDEPPEREEKTKTYRFTNNP